MRKFKGGIHYDYVPLYGVAITFTTDKEKLLNMYGYDDDTYAGMANGLICYDTDMRNIGIFIDKACENKNSIVSTIAHECFHAAMVVGEMSGLEPTLTANEEIAYLISWLVNWVLECIDKEGGR